MSPLLNEEMSHQPLYLQIKEVLKKQILDGGYAPFDRLPSESTLMETFGVSRITVRQSLRDLQAEGLIFSSQGKGSFVSKPKAMQDVQYLEGLSEAMTPMGYETAAKLLSIREVKPIKDVQKNLNITSKDGAIESRGHISRHQLFSHGYWPETLRQGSLWRHFSIIRE